MLDTISAISTPFGTGGIAIIRVSGENAIKIVDNIFSKSLQKAKSHSAIFGKIIQNNELVDEVIITIFKAPKSYTGENVVEISCHGGVFIANRILEILLQNSRLAEAGEFTQRAFLNNKMDLTEAEAINDLLNAKTKFSHKAALEQMGGSLYRKINKLLQKLTEFRTQLELEIDFLEQDLPEIDLNELAKNMKQLLSKLQKLAATGELGTILREGLKISLVGAPNVGKSSIFNTFLESERAIVTPIPGTTRDYLEEAISLNGYLVRIFDTAGLRKTKDEIEKIGINRSFDIIKNSHKIIFIFDGAESFSEYQKLSQMVDENRIIKVLNKVDVLPKSTLMKFENTVFCSTIAENGLDDLKTVLLKYLVISDDKIDDGILANTRQIAAVNRAIKSLEKAINSLSENLGFEFTAFDLKEASTALEEIIGKISNNDILNQIFDNFCVGK